MPKTSFRQFSEGRENNFDFLRLFFATLVIFAHSFAFLYNGTLAGFDPLVRFSRGQVGLGGLAVDGFFLISGFLVTKSWLRSKGAWDYTKKRALRILPALVGVLLFCALVIGPLTTSLRLSAYFLRPQTWLYVGFMLYPQIRYHDYLPGVFAHNPLPLQVNHSLWTIRYEAICYVLVAVLGLISLYRRPRQVLAVGIGVYLLSVLPFSLHRTFGEAGVCFHLLLYFLVGMLFLLYQDVIPYSRGLFLF